MPGSARPARRRSSSQRSSSTSPPTSRSMRSLRVCSESSTARLGRRCRRSGSSSAALGRTRRRSDGVARPGARPTGACWRSIQPATAAGSAAGGDVAADPEHEQADDVLARVGAAGARAARGDVDVVDGDVVGLATPSRGSGPTPPARRPRSATTATARRAPRRRRTAPTSRRRATTCSIVHTCALHLARSPTGSPRATLPKPCHMPLVRAGGDSRRSPGRLTDRSCTCRRSSPPSPRCSSPSCRTRR